MSTPYTPDNRPQIGDAVTVTRGGHTWGGIIIRAGYTHSLVKVEFSFDQWRTLGVPNSDMTLTHRKSA